MNNKMKRMRQRTGVESSPRANQNTTGLQQIIVTPAEVNRKRFKTTVK
jgi:hypothetical protein